VNWRDEKGSWHKMNATLTKKDGMYRPASMPVDISLAGEDVFADGRDGRHLAVVGGSDWSVTTDIDGLNLAAPVKSGHDKLVYEAGNGVQVAQTVRNGAVEQDIVIDAAPESGDGVWKFKLGVDGLTPSTLDDGTVVFKNQLDEVALAVPQGVAFDSSEDVTGSPKTSPATVTLSSSEGSWALTVTVDGGWLRDPERVFPIVVDPSLEAGRTTGHWDAYVASNCGTCNYNGSAQIDSNAYTNKVGNSGGVDYASFLKFDIAPVMSKGVQSATLKLYGYTGAPSYPTRFAVWPLAENFTDSTVTWNTRPDKRSDLIIAQLNGQNQWINSDVTTWVSSWANGSWPSFSNKVGFALDGWAMIATGYTRLASAEQSFQQLDPVLSITYADFLPAQNATPVNKAIISDSTPTLTITPPTVPPGHTAQYWFRVATSPDGETGSVVNSGWIWDSTWTAPAGSLRNGGTYYWHVWTLEDGTIIAGAGAVTSFRLDRRLGAGGPSPTDSAGPVTVNLATGNASLKVHGPKVNTAGGSLGVNLTYDNQADPNSGLASSFYNSCNGSDPAPSKGVSG
jgi:hypothetical protein